METLAHFFNQINNVIWRETILTSGQSPSTAIDIEETMASELPADDQNGTIVVHVWQHPNALILGHRDRALPTLSKGVDYAKSLGYTVVVRHAGGTAVPLDRGVLNVSLIVPVSLCPRIEQGFILLSRLMTELLRDVVSLEVGKVAGSYCPGDYDLSCAGKKVAGIAQRRKRHAAVLTLFLNVEGEGIKRGKFMQEFYRAAGIENMESRSPVPFIDPAVIGSLTAITPGLTMDQIRALIRRYFLEQ